MPAEATVTASFAAIDAAHRFFQNLKTPGLILVAISGGSDSKGLLLALSEALVRGAYPGMALCACTVDHALRPQSAQEAEAVHAFCTARGIPHLTRVWQGEKPSTGLQAAARMARYRLLAEVALEVGALGIVTGHSADDQAETITMRASRSQPDAPGLAGMAKAVLFERSVWILRPFLEVGRAAIRDFLVARGAGWVDDPSNGNPRFERVRVRMAKPAATVADAVSSARARRASGENAARFLRRHVQVFQGLVARVDPAALADDGDRRRAILLLAAVIGGRPHPVGQETADRVAAFVLNGLDGRLTAGRVVFDRRRSGLYLYREARGLPDILVSPDEVAIWDGRFRVSNRGKGALPVRAVVPQSVEQGACIAGLVAAGLPEAIAKRASRAAIGFGSCDPQSLTAEVHIAPYDTFLPCFDRIIADAIAGLFGRESYPSPPVHLV